MILVVPLNPLVATATTAVVAGAAAASITAKPFTMGIQAQGIEAHSTAHMQETTGIPQLLAQINFPLGIGSLFIGLYLFAQSLFIFSE